MPNLQFEVVGVETPLYAAVPQLLFKLRVTNADPSERVHSIALRCQIQLAVTRRRYNPEEQANLVELFGEPSRWGDTLRSLLWTHTSMVVPQFTGTIEVDLPVACTYDFDVVSAKYFHALGEGAVPLNFLFSGTMFYEGAVDNLQVGQIPWDKEATFRLPIASWQEMMARFYPNSAWIRLQKDVFDSLYRYKAAHGLTSWEEALVRLLRAADEEVRA